MLDLDVLFSPTPYDHPRLRSWRSRLKSGEDISVEVKRPREGLVRLQPLLCVRSTSSGGKSIVEQEPWEYGLDLGLVEEGIRTRSVENEGERFGLFMRELLKPIEIRFGDGFFNGVFLDLVRNSDLARYPHLAEVLADVTANPIRPRAEKDDCAARIRAVLSRCAGLLVSSLHYSREAAESILATAVAHYLDDRFSVSNRKLLGW